jgi:hypothetical protein
VEVPGMKLVTNYHLKFGAGGEKGRKDAEKRSIKKMKE